MKLVKYPARTVIVKLFCDCEKGELIHQSTTSQEEFVHKCSNQECGKEVRLNQRFPHTQAEIVNVMVEDVVQQEDKNPETSQESKEE